jgi:hypothetical protein
VDENSEILAIYHISGFFVVVFSMGKTREAFSWQMKKPYRGMSGNRGFSCALLKDSIILPCASMAAETELLNWALSNHITDSAAGHSSCLGHTITIASFPHAGG